MLNSGLFLRMRDRRTSSVHLPQMFSPNRVCGDGLEQPPPSSSSSPSSLFISSCLLSSPVSSVCFYPLFIGFLFQICSLRVPVHRFMVAGSCGQASDASSWCCRVVGPGRSRTRSSIRSSTTSGQEGGWRRWRSRRCCAPTRRRRPSPSWNNVMTSRSAGCFRSRPSRSP